MEVAHAQRVANKMTDDNTKLQGTAATIELTDYKQSTGEVSDDDDDNLSTGRPIGAGIGNDDGLQMTGLQVT